MIRSSGMGRPELRKGPTNQQEWIGSPQEYGKVVKVAQVVDTWKITGVSRANTERKHRPHDAFGFDVIGDQEQKENHEPGLALAVVDGVSADARGIEYKQSRELAENLVKYWTGKVAPELFRRLRQRGTDVTTIEEFLQSWQQHLNEFRGSFKGAAVGIFVLAIPNGRTLLFRVGDAIAWIKKKGGSVEWVYTPSGTNKVNQTIDGGGKISSSTGDKGVDMKIVELRPEDELVIATDGVEKLGAGNRSNANDIRGIPQKTEGFINNPGEVSLPDDATVFKVRMEAKREAKRDLSRVVKNMLKRLGFSSRLSLDEIREGLKKNDFLRTAYEEAYDKSCSKPGGCSASDFVPEVLRIILERVRSFKSKKRPAIRIQEAVSGRQTSGEEQNAKGLDQKVKDLETLQRALENLNKGNVKFEELESALSALGRRPETGGFRALIAQALVERLFNNSVDPERFVYPFFNIVEKVILNSNEKANDNLFSKLARLRRVVLDYVRADKSGSFIVRMLRDSFFYIVDHGPESFSEFVKWLNTPLAEDVIKCLEGGSGCNEIDVKSVTRFLGIRLIIRIEKGEMVVNKDDNDVV